MRSGAFLSKLAKMPLMALIFSSKTHKVSTHECFYDCLEAVLDSELQISLDQAQNEDLGHTFLLQTVGKHQPRLLKRVLVVNGLQTSHFVLPPLIRPHCRSKSTLVYFLRNRS